MFQLIFDKNYQITCLCWQDWDWPSWDCWSWMGTDHRPPSPSNTLRSRCSWSSGACCFCSWRCWRRVGHGGWCSRWARCCCWVSCWTRSASVCCWCWGTRRRSCCSGRLGSGQRCWKCKEGFMCRRKVIKWYFCEKNFFFS